MRRNSDHPKAPAEKVVKDIRRATRRWYSAEEKIRIVLEGLRGEDSIAALYRREGFVSGMAFNGFPLLPPRRNLHKVSVATRAKRKFRSTKTDQGRN